MSMAMTPRVTHSVRMLVGQRVAQRMRMTVDMVESIGHMLRNVDMHWLTRLNLSRSSTTSRRARCAASSAGMIEDGRAGVCFGDIGGVDHRISVRGVRVRIRIRVQVEESGGGAASGNYGLGKTSDLFTRGDESVGETFIFCRQKFDLLLEGLEPGFLALTAFQRS